MREFSLDEMETTFTIEATDRSIAHVYSNDVVFQRKLERVGCESYRTAPDGGKWYKLPINQLRISMPPRELTDEQRQQATERFRKAREAVAN